jgi:hypothetical protein
MLGAVASQLPVLGSVAAAACVGLRGALQQHTRGLLWSVEREKVGAAGCPMCIGHKIIDALRVFAAVPAPLLRAAPGGASICNSPSKIASCTFPEGCRAASCRAKGYPMPRLACAPANSGLPLISLPYHRTTSTSRSMRSSTTKVGRRGRLIDAAWGDDACGGAWPAGSLPTQPDQPTLSRQNDPSAFTTLIPPQTQPSPRR